MIATNALTIPPRPPRATRTAMPGGLCRGPPPSTRPTSRTSFPLARQRAATRGVPIKAREVPGEKLQCVDEADEAWRNRMESLRDVDDMIAELLVALRDEGFARHTYVILTSDNGFELYQNRVYSKGSPYEPSQRVPFIVRGPGCRKTG